MRKVSWFVLTLGLVCGLVTSTVFAGPGCGGQKADAKAGKGCCASAKTSDSGEFPTMVMRVGDKTLTCPMTAKKLAKDSGGKVMFVVAGKSYEDKAEAQGALASASEEYVQKFTKIGCFVDGKVVYCDDKEVVSSPV